MPPDPNQARREECRSETRRYLAERQALAFAVATIQRKLRMDGDDFTEDEIESACQFLCHMAPPQAVQTHAEHGSTKYYQATSAGVLAHERRV